MRGQFSRRRSGGGVSLQGFEEMLHRPPGRLLLCVQSHRLRRHLRQTPRASLACIFPSNEASSTIYIGVHLVLVPGGGRPATMYMAPQAGSAAARCVRVRARRLGEME